MLYLLSQAMKDFIREIKNEFKFIKSNPESIVAVVLILIYLIVIISIAFRLTSVENKV